MTASQYKRCAGSAGKPSLNSSDLSLATITTVTGSGAAPYSRFPISSTSLTTRHGTAHDTAMSDKFTNKHDVVNYIDEHMVVKYKFRGYPQPFLANSDLEKVTKRAVIQHIVKQDELKLNDYEEDKLVERIYNHGRKLFATCVYCSITIDFVRIMLENGLTDDKLPFRQSDFRSLSEHRTHFMSFLSSQKLFVTMRLEEGGFQMLSEDDSVGLSIPIWFEEKPTNLKGKGAFGSVYQVTIHPEQHSFKGWTNEEDLFAMKITDNNEPPRESQELKFHLGMAGQEHLHLVKCRASFSVGTRFHMIYDLAYSDLEGFMVDNPGASKTAELSESWIAQQLAGLVGAIKVVHNPAGPQRLTGSNTLDVPPPHQERTGFIHDIKPENILVFRTHDKKFLLKLSDFSCARIAEYIATISGRRESYKTKRMAGTAIYRAPESLENATSRPYDMWSLGCVFLEILVWYLDGFEALELFRDSRMGQVFPHGSEDEGFYYKKESGAVELREPVVKMISDLQGKCTGDLKDIADTIPKLLQIDPKKRPRALDLEHQLRRIGTRPIIRTSSSLPNGKYPVSLSVNNATPARLRADSGSSFDKKIIITRPSDDSKREVKVSKA